MEIKILSKDVERVERVWEGQKHVSYAQWAVLTQGGFMLSFVVSHNAESDALAPGNYVLDPTSFSSKNGRLMVDRVKLKPAGASQLPGKA